MSRAVPDAERTPEDEVAGEVAKLRERIGAPAVSTTRVPPLPRISPPAGSERMFVGASTSETAERICGAARCGCVTGFSAANQRKHERKLLGTGWSIWAWT